MIIIRKLSLFVGLVALIGLAGCGGGGGRNPASVYCTQHGGTSEIRDEAGGQVGYCVFADGSECEEFAYMNGECAPGDSLSGGGAGLANPASVYCEEQGGRLEIRDEEAGQVGYCLFDDGSECEEWAFYRGECAVGDSLNDY